MSAASARNPEPAEPPAPLETTGARTGRRRRVLAAVAFGAAVAAPALLGSRFSVRDSQTRTWYRSLRKPPFQPPAAAFGPVWSVLYPMIGAAGYRVWRAPDSSRRRVALALWGVQLAANAAWSPTFFGAKAPRPAAAVLAVQEGTSLAFLATARHVDGVASLLFAPYVGWSGFAGLLNAEIIRRNPHA